MSWDDKIAIIGVGCRFPGADNIDEFWKVLLHGENHVVDIPSDRWNVDAIYDADPDAPGKTYVRKAGLIVGHNKWDNTFFGISDLEAEQIDPQQRLVLDCVHMAMENAGVRKTDLNGSSTGVYLGTMNDDFTNGMNEDSAELTNYSVTGSARSIISARVSYLYNLLGPSMTIDTACSSALVAIHTGIQAIKMGDCNMAFCGGVNSILYPELFIALSKARMLSPSGQCQPFSAKADGYARGEGCGIILLKKLSDAQKDGDYIWGTIKTGCNQDGHTASPMTAPSLSQQKHLLEKIYRENNVDPCSVQYIEAHENADCEVTKL